MENEITDKEEYAKKLAAKAEKALKFLKITVLITAASAVALSLVTFILLLTVKGISAAITIGICLGIFVVLLAALAGVFIYVRKILKKLKELDAEQNK